jgi:threonine aldolase
VLVSDTPLIARARRWRKMLGGGMRQAGIIAAAGLYALEHHVDRLIEDHANARALADGFAGIEGLRVTPPQSNMVFVDLLPELATRLSEALRELGIAGVSGRVDGCAGLPISTSTVSPWTRQSQQCARSLRVGDERAPTGWIKAGPPVQGRRFGAVSSYPF